MNITFLLKKKKKKLRVEEFETIKAIQWLVAPNIEIHL